ncbi:AIPR family protein, partial [Parasutterella sp.]|uniref:AIPR family protein n=1 Tax=Parasutterella sp. TaxID=2049037 RepID=UPI00399BA6AC
NTHGNLRKASGNNEKNPNWLSRERSAYEVCSQIIKNKDRISSVFIWILSNRFADGEYIRRSNITLWGQPVELVRRVVDLSYLADSDAEKAHNFLDFSPVGGIDVLKLNLGDNSQFDCYLASIPATYLVQIYSAYGTRLIEKNVRAYLGNKKANKGIESTIKEAPETFVALNNGLVMVAEDVETSAGKLKKLKNFQIVNGGQTTATLYYTYKAAERMKKKDEGKRIKDNFAKIQVPLKIVRIKKSTLESDGFDFAAQIPIAANTQNAIKASDLSASVKYYQEFEKISRELTTSNGDYWFFERARGSYKAEEDKFIGQRKGKNIFRTKYPKEKMFDKTDLAVSALCWDLKPMSACKGAQLAFLEFNEGVKERIPDVKEVKELICKWLIFSTLERRLKEENRKNPRTIVNYSIKRITIRRTIE